MLLQIRRHHPRLHAHLLRQDGQPGLTTNGPWFNTLVPPNNVVSCDGPFNSARLPGRVDHDFVAPGQHGAVHSRVGRQPEAVDARQLDRPVRWNHHRCVVDVHGGVPLPGGPYPDVFAALGVHSGGAFPAATNVMQGLATMRGETPAAAGGGLRPPR